MYISLVGNLYLIVDQKQQMLHVGYLAIISCGPAGDDATSNKITR